MAEKKSALEKVEEGKPEELELPKHEEKPKESERPIRRIWP